MKSTLRETEPITSTLLLLGLTLAIGAVPSFGVTNAWYGPANFTGWPATWTAIPGLNDPSDAGVAAQLDFVGDSTNHCGFWAYNDTNLFFRMRVAVSNVTGTTFRDSHWVYIDIVGHTNGAYPDGMPDYAITWDSKSDSIEHGEELQVNSNKNVSAWASVALDDLDGLNAKKMAPPDINITGDGYIRTIDNQSTTNLGNTTFIDFAVGWSCLTSSTALARGQTWRIQFGSIQAATDHNSPNADIAGGFTPESVVTTAWPSAVGVLMLEPTVNATNMSFPAVGVTNLTVQWTSGNGARRILVASTNPIVWIPTDGTNYAANPNYSVAPDQGGDVRVVYNGSSNVVEISGLTGATRYHFKLFEYSGSGLTANYLTTGIVAVATQETFNAVHTIGASAGPFGQISPSGVVSVAHGAATNFVIVPDTYYCLTSLWVDAVSVALTNSYTFTNVCANHSISAAFDAVRGARGTPAWWLASQGLTNETWDLEEVKDTDEDGSLAWQEYVAGTSPTNPSSVLKITAIAVENGTNRIHWLSASGSVPYSVWSTTNLLLGTWDMETNRVDRNPPTNEWQHAAPSSDRRFYRIVITNGP